LGLRLRLRAMLGLCHAYRPGDIQRVRVRVRSRVRVSVRARVNTRVRVKVRARVRVRMRVRARVGVRVRARVRVRAWAGVRLRPMLRIGVRARARARVRARVRVGVGVGVRVRVRVRVRAGVTTGTMAPDLGLGLGHTPLHVHLAHNPGSLGPRRPEALEVVCRAGQQVPSHRPHVREHVVHLAPRRVRHHQRVDRRVAHRRELLPRHAPPLVHVLRRGAAKVAAIGAYLHQSRDHKIRVDHRRLDVQLHRGHRVGGVLHQLLARDDLDIVPPTVSCVAQPLTALLGRSRRAHFL
tara:strand:- start:55 stop:939 length:885 start_codon:yes stop_codon:yes gene_type:complete